MTAHELRTANDEPPTVDGEERRNIYNPCHV
jgi:hypothetical protein